jgi:hypothetical protein
MAPELFRLAMPPPVVWPLTNPATLPELIVVEFWFAPFALLAKEVATFPEFVQVMSVGVVEQTNCADAGELASIAAIATAAIAVPRMMAGIRKSLRSLSIAIIMPAPTGQRP